jgi:hypothetical protein
VIRRRLGPPVLGGLAVGLVAALTGCGVTATGVIDAGDGARGAVAPRGEVYFQSAGALLPVERVGVSGVDAALQELFKGPLDIERQRGVGTDLPPDLRLTTTVDRRILPTAVGRKSDSIIIVIDRDPAVLTDKALAQISCTVVKALPPTLADATRRPQVLVMSSGGPSRTTGDCPLDIGPTPGLTTPAAPGGPRAVPSG